MSKHISPRDPLFGGTGWQPVSLETGEEGLARAVIFKAIIDYRNGYSIALDDLRIKKSYNQRTRESIYIKREKFRDYKSANYFFFNPKSDDLLVMWCGLVNMRAGSFRKSLKLWIAKDCPKPGMYNMRKV